MRFAPQVLALLPGELLLSCLRQFWPLCRAGGPLVRQDCHLVLRVLLRLPRRHRLLPMAAALSSLDLYLPILDLYFVVLGLSSGAEGAGGHLGAGICPPRQLLVLQGGARKPWGTPW